MKALTPFDYDSLGDLAAPVKGLADRIKSTPVKSRQSAIDVGRLLANARPAFTANGFDHWIRIDLGISRSSAYRWMKCARHVQNGERVSKSGTLSTMYATASPRGMRNRTNAEIVRGVYFVSIGLNGPVKIGFSTDIERRVKAIQVDSPERVRVCGIIRNGSREMERSLHSQFAAIRIRGEWFQHSEALSRFIALKTSVFSVWDSKGLDNEDASELMLSLLLGS